MIRNAETEDTGHFHKSANKFERLLLTGFLLLGLTAYLFTSGKWNVPVMPWIWMACLLFFLRKARKTYGMLTAFGGMALISIVKWYGFVGNSLLLNIFLGMAMGALNCVPFLLDRLLYGRLPGYKAVFLFPLACAAEEELLQFLPFGPLGAISATQTGNDPLVQIASVLGSSAIAFLIAWLASSGVYAAEHWKL